MTGVDAFGDGVTGGDEDGEPFDTRVDLDGRIQTAASMRPTRFLSATPGTVTLSGRYNRTTIDNRDRIRPAAGPARSTAITSFDRFNPAAGVTFSPPRAVNLYFGYSEGNRAPTSIELGCADPEQPCKLPNAMAGDPPLEQVVTRTVEAGVRGGTMATSRTSWNAGGFRADNRDDILFVASEQTGLRLFQELRQDPPAGLELGANSRIGRRHVRRGVYVSRRDIPERGDRGRLRATAPTEAATGLPGTRRDYRD